MESGVDPYCQYERQDQHCNSSPMMIDVGKAISPVGTLADIEFYPITANNPSISFYDDYASNAGDYKWMR